MESKSFTLALIKDLFLPLPPLLLLLLLLCAISGREDWTWQGSGTRRIKDQEKAAPFCRYHFHLLSGQLGSYSSKGDLNRRVQRPNVFLRKKEKKAVPFCSTQGCPTNTEVLLLCVIEQSGKGRNAKPCLPNGKKLLQTVSLQYVQSTL